MMSPSATVIRLKSVYIDQYSVKALLRMWEGVMICALIYDEALIYITPV
jgi:hypothetical protein